MIKIKMFDGDWRILIEDEQWRFETREQLDEILKIILDAKEKFGKIYDRRIL